MYHNRRPILKDIRAKKSAANNFKHLKKLDFSKLNFQYQYTTGNFVLLQVLVCYTYSMG